MTNPLPQAFAQANITFDEHYYETFYSEWLRFRCLRRKFGLISAVAFTFGAVCLGFVPRLRNVGIALIIVGIGYLIDVLTYKRRWIRRRLSARGSPFVQIDFFEDRISMKSERSESVHQIPGFVDITAGARGIFLYPIKDISFYIPWISIEPADAVPKVRELLLSKGKINRADPPG